MKDKKTILLLLVGILLGVTIMGGVVCFAVSKVKLVDKTYAAKVNNSNEEATKSTKEVPVYEYYESKVEESKKENQTPKANTNTSTKSNTTEQYKSIISYIVPVINTMMIIQKNHF